MKITMGQSAQHINPYNHTKGEMMKIGHLRLLVFFVFAATSATAATRMKIEGHQPIKKVTMERALEEKFGADHVKLLSARGFRGSHDSPNFRTEEPYPFFQGYFFRLSISLNSDLYNFKDCSYEYNSEENLFEFQSCPGRIFSSGDINLLYPLGDVTLEPFSIHGAELDLQPLRKVVLRANEN